MLVFIDFCFFKAHKGENVKSFLIRIFGVACITFSYANDPQMEPGFHKHDGFFLSLNIGLAAGGINLAMENTFPEEIKFSGAGSAIEFKIGGALKENLLLHADVSSRVIGSPNVSVDGKEGTTSNKVSANDQVIGVGLTYYFMPYNMFLQGGIGSGKFGLVIDDEKYESENGLSFSVKVGKEWWVSKNWGLGISLGFNQINADDKKDPNNPEYSGKLSTSKFFVLFNTSFN